MSFSLPFLFFEGVPNLETLKTFLHKFLLEPIDLIKCWLTPLFNYLRYTISECLGLTQLTASTKSNSYYYLPVKVSCWTDSLLGLWRLKARRAQARWRTRSQRRRRDCWGPVCADPPPGWSSRSWSRTIFGSYSQRTARLELINWKICRIGMSSKRTTK